MAQLQKMSSFFFQEPVESCSSESFNSSRRPAIEEPNSLSVISPNEVLLSPRSNSRSRRQELDEEQTDPSTKFPYTIKQSNVDPHDDEEEKEYRPHRPALNLNMSVISGMSQNLGGELFDSPVGSIKSKFSKFSSNRLEVPKVKEARESNRNPSPSSPSSSQIDIGIIPEEYANFHFKKKIQHTGKSKLASSFTSRLQKLVEEKMRATKKSRVQRQWQRCNEMVVISTAHPFYQLWKVLNIITSFISSFEFLLHTAFWQDMNEADEASFLARTIFYQVFFSVDMAINFVTEHTYESSAYTERDLCKLFTIYLKGRFLFDLLALLPLRKILSGLVADEYSYLLDLVKLLRLYVGFKLLAHKNYMKQIKLIFHNRMKKLIEQDEELADNQVEDNNGISKILAISYLLKTFQLIVVILSGSFITGIIWYILCDLFPSEEAVGFIPDFYLNEQQLKERVVTLTYFMFTSLSTVGLGDFHPRSNFERGLGAFVLLFGVSITSLIIENLMRMILQMNSLAKSFEQSQMLSLFFGTMEKFNGERPLKPQLVEELEQYFYYRWQHHKNNAISTQEDEDLLVQLPRKVQIQIYSEFLFKDFVQAYSKYFQNTFTNLQRQKSIQWTHQHHSELATFLKYERQNESLLEFQNSLLKYLEPKEYMKNFVLQGQKEHFSEIVFLMEGKIVVGYNTEYFLFENGIKSAKELSKKVIKRKATRKKIASLSFLFDDKKKTERNQLRFQFPLFLGPGQAVGLFETLYEKKTQFVYKINRSTSAHCFFIRRSNWHKFKAETEEEFSEGFKSFKKHVLVDYINKIYYPIQSDQSKLLQEEEDERRKRRQSREMSRQQHMERAQNIASQMAHHKYSSNNVIGAFSRPILQNESEQLNRKNTQQEVPEPEVIRRYSELPDRRNMFQKKSSIFEQVAKTNPQIKSITNKELNMVMQPERECESIKSRSFLSRQDLKSRSGYDSKVLEAITSIDHINDDELRSIVRRQCTREMESASNLSSLMKDSRFGGEINFDRYKKSIAKKMKKQEDLLKKLVQQNEIYIRLYMDSKAENRRLQEALDEKSKEVDRLKIRRNTKTKLQPAASQELPDNFQIGLQNNTPAKLKVSALQKRLIMDELNFIQQSDKKEEEKQPFTQQAQQPGQDAPKAIPEEEGLGRDLIRSRPSFRKESGGSVKKDFNMKEFSFENEQSSRSTKVFDVERQITNRRKKTSEKLNLKFENDPDLLNEMRKPSSKSVNQVMTSPILQHQQTASMKKDSSDNMMHTEVKFDIVRMESQSRHFMDTPVLGNESSRHRRCRASDFKPVAPVKSRGMDFYNQADDEDDGDSEVSNRPSDDDDPEILYQSKDMKGSEPA